MKAFNPALLGHAFSALAAYSQQEAQWLGMSGSKTVPVGPDRLDEISQSLVAARVIAVVLELAETRGALERLARDMKSPITHVTLHYALKNLVELMKNELDKRKAFAIDPAKSKYYLDDAYGVLPPGLFGPNALLEDQKPPEPLFSRRAIAAFPSAYTHPMWRSVAGVTSIVSWTCCQSICPRLNEHQMSGRLRLHPGRLRQQRHVWHCKDLWCDQPRQGRCDALFAASSSGCIARGSKWNPSPNSPSRVSELGRGRQSRSGFRLRRTIFA
jgi:hypothetical protein